MCVSVVIEQYDLACFFSFAFKRKSFSVKLCDPYADNNARMILK